MLENLNNLDDFAECDVAGIQMDDFVANLKRLFDSMGREIQDLREKVTELENRD